MSDHNRVVKIAKITARGRINYINNSVFIGESVDMSVMPGLICAYCLWKSCFASGAGLKAKTLVQVSTLRRGLKLAQQSK